MADFRRHYGDGMSWTPRERGGYWRHYEGLNDPGPNFGGRGLKDVSNQLRAPRELAGHHWTAGSSRASGPGTSSLPVTRASGKGTPSKSSDNSA